MIRSMHDLDYTELIDKSISNPCNIGRYWISEGVEGSNLLTLSDTLKRPSKVKKGCNLRK